MEDSRFQRFYEQLIDKLSSDLIIDKDKLSMILHTKTIEKAIEILLFDIKDIYDASQIELWFYNEIYNRYYRFDPSISIEHVYQSTTKSISSFQFESFIESLPKSDQFPLIPVITPNNHWSDIDDSQKPIYVLPINHQRTKLLMISQPKKTNLPLDQNALILQMCDLLSHFLYFDYINYLPYFRYQPTINLQVLLGIEEIVNQKKHRHEAKAASLAKAIATAHQLPFYTTEKIEIASKLHDIGYLFIPKKFQFDHQSLTYDEMTLLKTHVAMGSEILSMIGFSNDIVKLVLEHHERIDGSGYPQKLKNNRISIESQIVALADELSEKIENDINRKEPLSITSITEFIQSKRLMYRSDLMDTLNQMLVNHTINPYIS